MAPALAGNKPPLLLLLLLLVFSVTCSYGNQNQQFINSCGDIHNISFPFQLQGDPSNTCNDENFTLSCDEKNRTVLHLFSRKYYVKSINYTGSSIRLVDVGFQSNHICSSFPPSSLTLRDFRPASVPYWVPDASSIVFLSCENPVQSPSIYINKTGYCNSTRDNSGNGYYSYVVAGDVSIWDVADSCLLEAFYLSSSPLIGERGSNLSWLDFYKELGYGFVATFGFGYYEGCNRCKERASCFGHSVNVTAVCRDPCDGYNRQLLGLSVILHECMLSAISFFTDNEWNTSSEEVAKSIACRVPKDMNCLRTVESISGVDARSKQLRRGVAFRILVACLDIKATDAEEILRFLNSINVKGKSCDLFKIYIYLVLTENWLLYNPSLEDKPVIHKLWGVYLRQCSYQITSTDLRTYASKVCSKASYLLQGINNK